MTTTQHVSDLIRAVLDETAATTPAEIAREVLARVSDPQAALAECLPTFVQVSLSRSRMLSPLDEPQTADRGQVSADAQTAPAPVGYSRATRIRLSWEDRLNTPLRVGEAWKRLADCTADDLRTVAESLRGRAAKSLAKADWYDDLAAKLPKGATVAVLTAEQVAA